jgi:hypothetical protein
MKWEHNTRIGPNDWGDALKMQFALWQIVGPQYQSALANPSFPKT